jgi:hypothetical protein
MCNRADSAMPPAMLLWGSAQHTTGDKAFFVYIRCTVIRKTLVVRDYSF